MKTVSLERAIENTLRGGKLLIVLSGDENPDGDLSIMIDPVGVYEVRSHPPLRGVGPGESGESITEEIARASVSVGITLDADMRSMEESHRLMGTRASSGADATTSRAMSALAPLSQHTNSMS